MRQTLRSTEMSHCPEIYAKRPIAQRKTGLRLSNDCAKEKLIRITTHHPVGQAIIFIWIVRYPPPSSQAAELTDIRAPHPVASTAIGMKGSVTHPNITTQCYRCEYRSSRPMADAANWLKAHSFILSPTPIARSAQPASRLNDLNCYSATVCNNNFSLQRQAI